MIKLANWIKNKRTIGEKSIPDICGITLRIGLYKGSHSWSIKLNIGWRLKAINQLPIAPIITAYQNTLSISLIAVPNATINK